MTEINPNKGVPIQANVAPKEITTKQPAENQLPPITQEPAKEMTQKDLGNVPAAAIGQSQIQVMAPDSLEEDLKTFVENPELVKKSLYVGDKAEVNLVERGVEDANLKALNVAKAFADEFSK